ncbi:hypothetical protein BJY21_001343 [Kineosphaera limosa]|uniref:DUF485 domain-containing protein n=1 Tax=Kineosphaera limosa NBRC 100340 TaxID=1184609 RepID=K6WYT7_9MICO|nr:hypothetical protein [Kineosphaera limosa]NYE00159.1 hypothetical protein [Kineosphaera limosa]GAB97257.1 hypothetical protein KILIM_062_00040 [Kineosphaera limosa NBRC 100340]
MSLSGRGPTPKRVRITSPRRQAMRRPPTRPITTELDEQTALGQVYVDALLTAQRRLAVRLLGGMLLLVAVTVATFLGVPAVHAARIGPVPFTWLWLGGAAYVLLVLAALAYLRATERLEREFIALVRRSRT